MQCKFSSQPKRFGLNSYGLFPTEEDDRLPMLTSRNLFHAFILVPALALVLILPPLLLFYTTTAGAAAAITAIAAVAALPVGGQILGCLRKNTSSVCSHSWGTRHTRPCMHGRTNEPPLGSAFSPLHARIHLAAALAGIYGARVHIVEPA